MKPNGEPENADPFKHCTSCGWRWSSRDEFLSDPCIQLVGYQVNYAQLQEGFFLFNHARLKCGTTLSVRAGDFADLYGGPIFQESLKEQAGCPAFCSRRENLEPCEQTCECAFVRHVLQKVKQWPKRRATDAA